eukprot:5880583-Amphidinium_carterae.1
MSSGSRQNVTSKVRCCHCCAQGNLLSGGSFSGWHSTAKPDELVTAGRSPMPVLLMTRTRRFLGR